MFPFTVQMKTFYRELVLKQWIKNVGKNIIKRIDKFLWRPNGYENV